MVRLLACDRNMQQVRLPCCINSLNRHTSGFNHSYFRFVFSYYSTTIFCKVGISPFISTLVLGLVVMLASIVNTFIYDRVSGTSKDSICPMMIQSSCQVGRKTLGLFTLLVIGLDGLIVAILVHVYDSPPEIVGYTIAVFICLYAVMASTWK